MVEGFRPHNFAGNCLQGFTQSSGPRFSSCTWGFCPSYLARTSTWGLGFNFSSCTWGFRTKAFSQGACGLFGVTGLVCRRNKAEWIAATTMIRKEDILPMVAKHHVVRSPEVSELKTLNPAHAERPEPHASPTSSYLVKRHQANYLNSGLHASNTSSSCV